MPLTAADIMTKNLILLHPHDRVPRIAAILHENHVSAAPVVDAQGGLLGIVSEGDLVRPLSTQHSKRQAWWLGLLAEGEELADDFLDYLAQENRCAADIMKHDVITVPDTATIAEIVDLFTEHHIKRVPVMHDGQLAGIVTRSDIIRNMAAAA